MEAWQKFEKLISILGHSQICLEVENYFSDTELNEFCNHLQASYDIDVDDEIE